MTAPLFLLAPPRSYTSVINAMLGQHPQMFGLPELNLFNVGTLRELFSKISDEMGERNGLLRAVAEIYGGEQTPETITMAMHWAAAREDRSTGDVFREIAEKLSPLIPVEKSPAYTFSVQRLKRIYDAFPDARFIHLVRHPIPQSKSIMKLNDGVIAILTNSLDIDDLSAMVDPQISWHDINVNILNFLYTVPKHQQMRLRGENLMEEPEKYLKLICRWLELRDDNEAVVRMMHPELSPFACFGPITALFGNDPNFLQRPSFRRHKPNIPPLDSALPWRNDGIGLRPEVIELARELGYR